MLICSIMSLATGTSYGSAGSGGLAMMGIGIAMGFPPGMIAGAVICRALFGDKLSPFSDSTNLASGMANADLFSLGGGWLLPRPAKSSGGLPPLLEIPPEVGAGSHCIVGSELHPADVLLPDQIDLHRSFAGILAHNVRKPSPIQHAVPKATMQRIWNKNSI